MLIFSQDDVNNDNLMFTIISSCYVYNAKTVRKNVIRFFKNRATGDTVSQTMRGATCVDYVQRT